MVAETINIKNKALLKDQCYINGEWMGANDGSSSEVTNPANSERLGSLPNCGADETILAITAANEAQKIWAKTDAKEHNPEIASYCPTTEQPPGAIAHLLEQGLPIDLRYDDSYIPSPIKIYII